MTDAAVSSAFAPAAPVSASPAPPRRLPPQKIDIVRALKALRALLADKENTTAVFEIMQAMNGRSTWKGYSRLLSTDLGGRLAYERVELNDRLNDRNWVDSLPDGSVGAAYRHFVRSEELSAEGLAEISREAAAKRGVPVEISHPVAWFGRRIRDSHDIWHTLTGYGRDGLGELCLVGFSFAQTRSLGWLVIAVGGCLQSLRVKGGHLAVKAVIEGYRRGKAAAWLPGQDIEALLHEPLESARARLNLTPPTAYLSVPAEWRNTYVPSKG